MRLFIAIELPENIKGSLFNIQKEIGSEYAKIKWVSKNQIHVTLKFLGEVDNDKLMKLRPVKFIWNNNTNTPGKNSYGLIAEEVYEIYPESVNLDYLGRPESINYDILTTNLIGAYQQQQKEIEMLKKQIEEMKRGKNENII